MSYALDLSSKAGACELGENGHTYSEATCFDCGRCPCEITIYVGVPPHGSGCRECLEQHQQDAEQG